MIKVFIPEVKRKYNKGSLARGFWQNDQGKVYYDYIKVVNYKQRTEDNFFLKAFYRYLDLIKVSYKQEAIFFVNDKIGNIFYSDDKIQILPHRIYKEVSRKDLKQAIKEALKAYKGLTVYKEDSRYYIEVFTTI